MTKKTLATTLKTKAEAVKKAVVDVSNKLQNKSKLDIELDTLRGEYKNLKNDIKNTIDALEIDEKTEKLKKDLDLQMKKARANFAGFKDAREDKTAELAHGISTIIGDIRKKLKSLK